MDLDKEEEILIFVYGTLKHGEPNEYMMQENNGQTAKLTGNGITKRSFPLVIATRYNVPFLLDAPGTGQVKTSAKT